MHPNPKYYSIPTLTVTLNPDPKPKANLKAIYNPIDWRGTGTYIYHPVQYHDTSNQMWFSID